MPISNCSNQPIGPLQKTDNYFILDDVFGRCCGGKDGCGGYVGGKSALEHYKEGLFFTSVFVINDTKYIQDFLGTQQQPLGFEESLLRLVGPPKLHIEEDMLTDYVKLKRARSGRSLKSVSKRDT